MIDWWYAGRFASFTQRPFPAPNGEIDEDEARRRYDTVGSNLAILTPRSSTEMSGRGEGIVPYVIVPGKIEPRGFNVIQHASPGVRISETTWMPSADGTRLFCSIATIYDYDEIHPLRGAKTPPSFRAEVRNHEDGTSSILLSEASSPTVTTGKRTIPDLEALYAPVPDWGHWNDLFTAAPTVPRD